MRIVVTGGTGLVGKHIVDKLQQSGHEVITLGRYNADIRYDMLTSEPLTKQLQSLKPACLVLNAWCTEHGTFWQTPQNLLWQAANLRLAHQATLAGVEQIVGVGTCVEYGQSVAGLCNEDTTERQPFTLYGTSKDALFRTLISFCGQSGVKFAWGRLFSVFSPEEPKGKLLRSAAHAIKHGALPEIRHPASCFDFISAQQAGHGIAHLVEAGDVGAVNIATGKATTVAKAVSLLAEALGHYEIAQQISEREPASPSRNAQRLVADAGKIQKLQKNTIMLDLKECFKNYK